MDGVGAVAEVDGEGLHGMRSWIGANRPIVTNARGRTRPNCGTTRAAKVTDPNESCTRLHSRKLLIHLLQRPCVGRRKQSWHVHPPRTPCCDAVTFDNLSSGRVVTMEEQHHAAKQSTDHQRQDHPLLAS